MMATTIKDIIDNAMAFDFETKDPYIGKGMGGGWPFVINHSDIANGFAVCVCSQNKSGKESYYNYDVGGKQYRDINQFDIAKEKVLVGHNLPYDLGWYLAVNYDNKLDALEFLRDMYRRRVMLIDTKILAKLVDEHVMSVSLSALAKMYHVTQKSEYLLANDFYNSGAYAEDKLSRTGQKTHKRPAEKTLLESAYKNIDKVSADIVVEYCADDVSATYELFHKFIDRLGKEYDESDLVNLLQRYSTLTYLAVDMRLRGIKVDVKLLKASANKSEIKLKKAKSSIMSLLRQHVDDADVDYMTKFLLQFDWHPQNTQVKKDFAEDFKKCDDVNEMSDNNVKVYTRYLNKVTEFIDLIKFGNFDDLNFSGSSSHPALMFLLAGHNKDDFKITNKGRVSTDKKWIEEQKSKLGEKLNYIRKVEKIINGFFNPAINTQSELQTLNDDYGVTYPEFIVAGARSFRFSCRSPNLQQVPKRDPEFREICRGMFCADEHQKFLASDFSSQEQRLQVHIGCTLGLDSAKDLRDKFIADPDLDMHMSVGKLAGLLCSKQCADKSCSECKDGRDTAKTIGLGLGYGMGESKLCASLGYPTTTVTRRRNGKDVKFEVAGKEGKNVIDRYNKFMPFLKDSIAAVEAQMKKDGYIRSVCGRHIHCPYYFIGYKREYLYHKLYNYLIQGSAAGQLHKSLCMLYDIICSGKAGTLDIVGTVHDEILAVCSEIDKDQCQYYLADAMINSMDLHVPVRVDVQDGKNWNGDKDEENKSIQAD